MIAASAYIIIISISCNCAIILCASHSSSSYRMYYTVVIQFCEETFFILTYAKLITDSDKLS